MVPRSHKIPARFLRGLSLGLILLCVRSVWAGFGPPVIRRVVIRGNTRTRTAVIRRELLFARGQRLDSSRVEETARNLRRLLFLGRVDIRVHTQGDSADVTVEVQDLYARALSPLLSGQPGDLNYGGVALDYNFLGRGETVQVSAQHDAVTGNSATLFYQDPRLLGSHLALSTNLTLATEGHDLALSLARPFYALSTPWSFGFSAFSQAQIQRLYDNRTLTGRYSDRLDGGALSLARSFGGPVKFRPDLRLDLTDHRFSPSPEYAYAPDNRRRILPSLGFTLWQPRYETARFVRELGRTEDLQTGSWLSLRAGLSRTALGSDRNFDFYQVQLSPRFKFYRRGYAFLTAFLSFRHDPTGYNNLYALLEGTAYAQIRGVHTLALRIRWEALARTEDASQLLLGLDQGLRGYPPRRFDGTRRFLFNAEARPTLYRCPTFVLAGACFLDGGTAWTPGRTSPALSLAAGIGARLGLSRIYNNLLLRSDLAWAFRDRAWQLSVGIGQYF